MTFKKIINVTVSTNTSTGLVIGEETKNIEAFFAVRAAYITPSNPYAEVHISYDNSTWTLYKSFEFIPSYSSGVDILYQAEEQIKTLEEFDGYVEV